MKFSMTIDSRNAVFTGAGGRVEVSRILLAVAEGVLAGGDGCTLFEGNGNKCGTYDCDDERPDLENCEASDLFEFANDYGVALDDDPRDLSRSELVEGLESIGVACYDEESDSLLADAYGDSMLAGDLPGDCSGWRDACAEEWNS